MKDASPRRVAPITLVELGLILCVPALGQVANMLVDAAKWSVPPIEPVTFWESAVTTLGRGLVFLGPLVSVARVATIKPTPRVSPGEWLWIAESFAFFLWWALGHVLGVIGLGGYLLFMLSQLLLLQLAFAMVCVTLISRRRARYPAAHWLGILVVSATATYLVWGHMVDPPII